ncbi:unnamed protein product, partial [Effrenium voratum]
VLVGKTRELRDAQTEARQGWLRDMAEGRLLGPRAEEDPGYQDEDIVVYAADAFEVAKARQRYQYVMSALLLPPDAAAWAVAAAGAEADLAVATAEEQSAGENQCPVTG